MLELDAALRLSEILLALAFLQQSAEHMVGARAERWLFAPRIVLSLALLAGWLVPCVLVGLVLHAVVLLHYFNGPYNGGSDKMGMLVLFCLCAAALLPEGPAQAAVFGYLGLQVVLSYFVSGWVKVANAEWRSGQALCEVFDFSAYPVSCQLRRAAQQPRLMWLGSWGVILFELAFPLGLLWEAGLLTMLVLGAVFHVVNGMLFGLNRFVWAWVASYPALVWLQGLLSGAV
ncbi:MAG: HTTM domain-containing protein [Sulfitobacter sp.]